MADLKQNRLRRALQKISKPQTGWLDIFPAVIGLTDGTVLTGTPGEIYVRNVLNGQVLRVHNSVAPNTINLQVEVGRRVEQPNLWQVKGVRESYSVPAGSGYVAYHASQHVFPAADTVFVDRKQMLWLTVLVSDPENFTVTVYGSLIYSIDGFITIANQTIDLTSYIPIEGAIFVTIESDDAGVLTVNDGGTPFGAPELGTVNDIPTPAAGQHPVAVVMLFEGISTLLNDYIRLVQIFPAVGAPQTLDDLSNVEVSTPSDGQVLTFDSYSDTWIAADPTGGSVWGGITGTLSDQTDLQNALDAKADASDLSAHLSDSSDAHDASAISIVDSGDYYSGTDVEAALQEAAQGRMVLEVNANNIYSGASCGSTVFQGTIATLPGGAVLTYNVTTGNENIMVPSSTSQIGKMRLYNTTRGDHALISDCNTGTNTITLTDNVPAGWQVGDVITPESQTNTSTIGGGAGKFLDIELVDSGALNQSGILIDFQIADTGGAGQQFTLHPFESNAASKRITRNTQTAVVGDEIWMNNISNVFCMAWVASGAATFGPTIRLQGYMT